MGKESACIAGDTGDADLMPRVGQISWRRAGQPTPAFFPGESPKWCQSSSVTRHLAETRVTPLGWGGEVIHSQPQESLQVSFQW